MRTHLLFLSYVIIPFFHYGIFHFTSCSYCQFFILLSVFGYIIRSVVNLKDWRAYVERLDQYLESNKITPAERKRAIFLGVCGATTYQLTRDLVYPQKQAEKSYTQLVEIVTKHYNPKPSVTMQT